jgi:hypothetical protein
MIVRMRLLFLMMIVAGAAVPVFAQEPGCDPLHLYDIVIPALIDEASQQGAEEIVVIRYIPGDTSIDREFKITIIVPARGAITATRTDPALVSIRAQLRAAEKRKPAAACDELLKDIRLERRRFDDQRLLRRLLRRLNGVRLPVRLPSKSTSTRHATKLWTGQE